MKMNKSWSVPVASFVLATTLALIAGPKPGAIAREEGGATGPVVVCVSDVYNLVGHTLVGKKRISARCEVDYKGGVDGQKTYNRVGARCFVVVKVRVNTAAGVVIRPHEVELDASKFWDDTYKNVKDNKALEFKFHTNDAAIKKSVAGMLISPSETNLGEDPTSRNPAVTLKFSFYGQTKVVPGGKPTCDNWLTHEVATSVDPVTDTGYLDFTDPD